MKRLTSLTALLLVTCTPMYRGDDTRRQLLRSWGDSYIMPTYRELVTRTATLATVSTAFCSTAHGNTLDDVRRAWSDARRTWKHGETLAFGPTKQEPLRFGPKLDFWPARPETVEDLLYRTTPLTEALFDTAGAAAKGFPAIEYLLWEPGVDVARQFIAGDRRCAYLIGATTDLAKTAKGLHDAWDPSGGNYLGQLVDAGRSSTAFMSLHDGLGEVVNRMGFTVENMRGDKLSKPLGLTSGGTAQPKLSESQFSGRGVDDLRDALDGVERIYFGDEANDFIGLDDLLKQYGKDSSAAFTRELAASRAALDAIDVPLTRAVTEKPERVQAAIDALSGLQRLIQVDIINAAGLTLGFNDNDGD